MVSQKQILKRIETETVKLYAIKYKSLLKFKTISKKI